MPEEEIDQSSGPKFWPTAKKEEENEIESSVTRITMDEEDLPALLPNHLRGNKSSR